MATSIASLSKLLKAIGSYAESELAEAVNSLEPDQQKQLSVLTSSVHSKLKK